MSFREKMLWTALIAGIAPFLWYFSSIGVSLAVGMGVESMSIGRLVSVLVFGLVVMMIAVILVSRRSRGEGTIIPDEREHRIEQRGFTISYHMLCTGVLLTIGAAWLDWSAVIIVHILAFVFIMAELTRLVVEIHGLRRGY